MDSPTTNLPVLRESKKTPPIKESVQRKIKGLTLYCYNKETKEIKPVYGSNVIMEKNCLYVQALNLKNAKRKFDL